MKQTNVCKFSATDSSSDLSISCFVLECDEAVMRKSSVLKHNRMILVEQGEGCFVFGNDEHTFSAGTVIFGFEGESFALLSGENVRYLYIDFSGSRANSLCHRFAGFRRCGMLFAQPTGSFPACCYTPAAFRPSN